MRSVNLGKLGPEVVESRKAPSGLGQGNHR